MHVPTFVEIYFHGTTDATVTPAPIDTSLRATRVPGSDPPQHVDFSRGLRPTPRSHTPRSTGSRPDGDGRFEVWECQRWSPLLRSTRRSLV